MRISCCGQIHGFYDLVDGSREEVVVRIQGRCSLWDYQEVEAKL